MRSADPLNNECFYNQTLFTEAIEAARDHGG
jgi:hypothetical protein